jgi:hypothetical protein
MFSNPLPSPPEPIGHNCGGSNEVHGGPETASGEVALVLHRAVAACGRHVLRHDGGLCVGSIGDVGGFPSGRGRLQLEIRDVAAEVRSRS